MTIRNDGATAAADVVLVDNLPFGVQYVTATTSHGSCAAASKKVRTITCDIGSIAAGNNSASLSTAITR